MTDTGGGGRPARSRTALVVLAALLVVAVLLRLPDLGSAAGLNRNELNYVPKAIRYGGGNLNPGLFLNPPLTSYLMFVGEAAWYLAGRVTGHFASALDFKAQYFVDATPAFVTARLVVLALSVVGMLHAARFTKTLARSTGCTVGASTIAALLVVAAMAASPLLIERAVSATNDTGVCLAYLLAAHAAWRLADAPSMRRAVVAGIAVGISTGTKYTGVFAAAPVGLACLMAPGLTGPRRLGAMAVAAATSLVTFVVVCPWILLDRKNFFAQIGLQYAGQYDRFQDGRGWFRYAQTAWNEGLGPVWSVLAVCGIVYSVFALWKGDAAKRRAWAILLAAIGPLTLYMATRPQLAYGSYLLPAYLLGFLFAALFLVSVRGILGTCLRFAAAIGAVVWIGAVAAIQVDRAGEPSQAIPGREMAAWMRENVPDGAYVITDLYPPWLPDFEARKEFVGKVPESTLARMTPAFRLTTAYLYFPEQVRKVAGTDVSSGDFDAIAALGPSYVLVTQAEERIFSKLPPGDFPPLAWHRAVEAKLRPVHVTGEGAARMTLYAVR